MASAHIELSGNETRLAGQFRAAVDSLQSVVNQWREMKATMDQAASGSDWPGLRAAFGFTSDAHAEAAYNLTGSVTTALTSDSFITQMLSRLG